jgi:hypothetical protein
MFDFTPRNGLTRTHPHAARLTPHAATPAAGLRALQPLFFGYVCCSVYFATEGQWLVLSPDET